MLRSEVLRDFGCIVGLVEAGLAEPDRERLDPLLGNRLRPRRDQRRIDASRKEDPQRHIGDKPLAHGPVERSLESIQRLGFIGDAGLGSIRSGIEGRPVSAYALQQVCRRTGGLVDRHRQAGARRQLDYAFVDGSGRRDVTVTDIEAQCLAINCGPVKSRIGDQRLQLRTEHQLAVADPDIERLLADPVAHEGDFAPFPVINRDGEHAGRLGDSAIDAIAIDGCQQHLGVRMPAEPDARILERLPGIEEAEDLAVEHEGVAPAHRVHRLRASLGDIDDREPPVAERDAPLVIGPGPLGIRSAMDQTVDHRLQSRPGRWLALRAVINESGNSAHCAHPMVLAIARAN